MISPTLLIGLGVLLIVGGLIFSRRRQTQRRHQLMEDAFPAAWDEMLHDKFESYPRLPNELRTRLQQYTQVLVAEKRWEACGGLPEVTDEMKVLIAAQAALLLIGRGEKDRFYPTLKSILVYPGAFRDRGRRKWGLSEDDDDDGSVKLGESWTTGSVILAWDSVKRGAADTDNGMNVTYHEFAHQLDQVDGVADGFPELEDSQAFQAWAAVMSEEYEELVEATNESERTLLDEYGATNAAEFFAVATETFFEKPRQMLKEHPALYEELRRFYQLDPATWTRLTA